MGGGVNPRTRNPKCNKTAFSIKQLSIGKHVLQFLLTNGILTNEDQNKSNSAFIITYFWKKDDSETSLEKVF